MTTLGLENAIAISADFHTHTEFDKFRDRFEGQLHGMMGIYDLIASMARALTTLEDVTPDIWEQCVFGLDWVEFVEHYVDFYIGDSMSTGWLADVDATLAKTKNLKGKS